MARYTTIMIETGTEELLAAGTKTVLLTSTFTSKPTIYVTAGGTSTEDPGSATVPAHNVNCYITNLAKDSGAWSFVINAELDDPLVKNDENKYTSVQVAWRAIGSTLAT